VKQIGVAQVQGFFLQPGHRQGAARESGQQIAVAR